MHKENDNSRNRVDPLRRENGPPRRRVSEASPLFSPRLFFYSAPWTCPSFLSISLTGRRDGHTLCMARRSIIPQKGARERGSTYTSRACIVISYSALTAARHFRVRELTPTTTETTCAAPTVYYYLLCRVFLPAHRTGMRSSLRICIYMYTET